MLFLVPHISDYIRVRQRKRNIRIGSVETRE